MTTGSRGESSPLERAEHIVVRLGEEATQVAKSALARALELAEDVWAEAQSVRKSASEQ